MLKQTKLEDKTVKSIQILLVLVGLHDFQIFLDRRAHVWSVEVEKNMFYLSFFVQVGSQISPRRAKKDSHIPSPGRTRSVKCPTPGPTKTIKSPPHALPPPNPQPALQWCTYQWFAPGWEGGQPKGNSLSWGELISTHNSLHCSTECLQRETITRWQNNGTYKLCALPQV